MVGIRKLAGFGTTRRLFIADLAEAFPDHRNDSDAADRSQETAFFRDIGTGNSTCLNSDTDGLTVLELAGHFFRATFRAPLEDPSDRRFYRRRGRLCAEIHCISLRRRAAHAPPGNRRYRPGRHQQSISPFPQAPSAG